MSENALTIREASEADLGEIQRIEDASFGKYDEPYPPELFRGFLWENPSGFLVAELNGRVAGYCYASRPKRKRVLLAAEEYESTIYSLAVSPGMRRRGVAKALVEEAVRRIRGLGFDSVTLKLQVSVDNLGAQTLYFGLGFLRSGFLQNYYGRGRDAIEMKLCVRRDG